MKIPPALKLDIFAHPGSRCRRLFSRCQKDRDRNTKGNARIRQPAGKVSCLRKQFGSEARGDFLRRPNTERYFPDDLASAVSVCARVLSSFMVPAHCNAASGSFAFIRTENCCTVRSYKG